jgi:hypothetical protein
MWNDDERNIKNFKYYKSSYYSIDIIDNYIPITKYIKDMYDEDKEKLYINIPKEDVINNTYIDNYVINNEYISDTESYIESEVESIKSTQDLSSSDYEFDDSDDLMIYKNIYYV